MLHQRIRYMAGEVNIFEIDLFQRGPRDCDEVRVRPKREPEIPTRVLTGAYQLTRLPLISSPSHHDMTPSSPTEYRIGNIQYETST